MSEDSEHENKAYAHLLYSAVIYNSLSSKDDGFLETFTNAYVADTTATAVEALNPTIVILLVLIGTSLMVIGNACSNFHSENYIY